MNKLEIQKRVLKNGKPLDLDLFSWVEETRSFSTSESELTIDFNGLSNCTIDCGNYSTIKCGYDCTIKCGYDCTIKCGRDCTIDCGSYCAIVCGGDCIINCGRDCTIVCSYDCYILNDYENNVLILRNNSIKKIYDLDDYSKGKIIYFEISNLPIIKDINYKSIKNIDNTIMLTFNEKQIDNMTIYKSMYIADYFKNDKNYVFVANKDNLYAHGNSIKQAIDDLSFKIAYKNGAKENAIKLIANGSGNMYDYRLLTGSCQDGTEHFLNKLSVPLDTKMTIQEMVDFVTEHRAYKYETFIRVLKENGWRETK